MSRQRQDPLGICRFARYRDTNRRSSNLCRPKSCRRTDHRYEERFLLLNQSSGAGHRMPYRLHSVAQIQYQMVIPMRISVNTATQAEVEQLPGIGPALSCAKPPSIQGEEGQSFQEEALHGHVGTLGPLGALRCLSNAFPNNSIGPVIQSARSLL